jgi:small redox-active disulfide protein 2
MEIKILGTGCAKCDQTEKLVKQVLSETGVNAQVEKVADVKSIAKYGVMLTPAVVVDGEVKIVGKIPRKEDIKTWIGK